MEKKQSLPAKLIPPSTVNVFRRHGLVERLHKATETPVIWIGGPGGSGKTTLVADYLDSSSFHALWYQMDETDTDLASFFHFLALALKHASPRFRRPLPKLTPDYQLSTETFARNLMQEVNLRLSSPYALVLDNAQLVGRNDAFFRVLLAAVGEVTNPNCVIIISRTEPPEIFARMTINKQMTRIGWHDLRLSEIEARNFMDYYKPASGNINTARLLETSDGWMAGLILLLEGSQAQKMDSVVNSNHQILFDYFISEVFIRRPTVERSFLMHTALLPFFTAEMAQQLTGHDRTPQLLNDLVRHHHFTELRKEFNKTYQYHPLFREFLQQQANLVFPADELNQLRRKAADILVQFAEPEPALTIYIQAGEVETATNLILMLAADYLDSGRIATLENAIAQIPQDHLAGEPWLLYWRGICRLSTPVLARNDLQDAYEIFDARDDAAGLYLAWAAIINSYNIEWSDFRPTDEWIEAFSHIQSRHPVFPSKMIEAQAIFALLTVLLNRRLCAERTDELARQAADLLVEGADIGQRGTFGVSLVLYYCYMGEVEKAKRISNFLSTTLDSRPDPSVTSVLQVGIGYNECMHGDIDTALERVGKGLETMEQSGALAWVIQVWGEHIYAHLTGGDADSVEPYLEKMKAALPMAGRIHTTFYYNLASITAAHQGNLALAAEHARAATRSVRETGPSYGEIDCFLAEAHIAWSTGDRDTAYRALSDLRKKYQESGSLWCGYCAMLTQGRFSIRDNPQAAVFELGSALAMSRQMHGRNLPWISHDVLREIFSFALAHQIESEHVAELIARHRLAPPYDWHDTVKWPFPVKIHSFGAFQILGGGKDLTQNAPAKPFVLLKSLLSSGGDNVPQEQLTDALWADAEGDTGRRSFDITLHRLRKILGRAELLPLVNGKLSLDRRYCWVDMWELDRVLDTVDVILKEDKRGDDIEEITGRIFELYRGPFLNEHKSETWPLVMREKYHVRVMTRLEKLGCLIEKSSALEKAIDYYEQVLLLDPLQEHIYRRLILLYLELGRKTDAVQTYARCENQLKNSLNIKPSIETARMLDRI